MSCSHCKYEIVRGLQCVRCYLISPSIAIASAPIVFPDGMCVTIFPFQVDSPLQRSKEPNHTYIAS